MWSEEELNNNVATEDSLEVVLKDDPDPPPPPEDENEDEDEVEGGVKSRDLFEDVPLGDDDQPDQTESKRKAKKYAIYAGVIFVILLVIIIPSSVAGGNKKTSSIENDVLVSNVTSSVPPSPSPSATISSLPTVLSSVIPSIASSVSPTVASSSSPSISSAPTGTIDVMINRLKSVSSVDSLSDPSLPQGQALDRLINGGDIDTTDEELVQKFALLTFFYSTNGTAWTDGTGWNGVLGTDVCQWTGITCGVGRRV